ncbi:MAG: hypothetical protein ACOCSD_06975 [Halolamina sp.]
MTSVEELRHEIRSAIRGAAVAGDDLDPIRAELEAGIERIEEWEAMSDG